MEILKIDDFRKDLRGSLQNEEISQRELFRMYGIHPACLSLFLSGKRSLSGEAVLRLLDFVYEPLVLKRHDEDIADQNQQEPVKNEKERN